ncbi:tRNA uridine-5-carboxymethylaminomethyl(34) synthesis GTPase MnmE [Hydrogenothermus marinus]|uniref:tRNA modification GTPase MnmE n=1 Tax=Hydrogenothermus marinus TaxID=133270 RepID=A0A3M0B8Z8_9AQUI|nr:tRNA uridine-5-carboxymethylaminomethyl(34) synthesis GTPase MnmE [Hydrogenothermus marinus]RMA93046.1 tRNA modification GTPase trmE [Hydrogenothermus marinus]
MEKDTIVANATPLVASAVSIIRISGKDALKIGKSIFSRKNNIEPRKVYFGKFIDDKGNIIDEGLFIYFKAPNSFTGEDVVEIQTHGSVPVVKQIIKQTIEKGARFAQPGEFTKRAFLNGKIDLTQAEAIAQLIEAKTEKATKAAVNLLEGKLSKQIKKLKEKLMNINMLIEAELNFPEDVEEIDMNIVKENLKEVIDEIKKLISTYKKGKIINEGIKLAIVGRPNVGKSSLFNALVGYERAIVSDIQGTTRDFIEESYQIDGIPIRLIDTAGVRDAKDEIEKIGIEKTKEKIKEADIVLFVFDVSEGFTEEDKKIYEEVKDKNPIIVGNKTDLILDKNQKKCYFKDIIYTSVKSQKGISELEKEILKNLHLTEDSDSEIYINLRHQESLKKALDVLNKIYTNFENYKDFKEILMIDIKEAENYLSEIIGEIATEDILGKIFSSFCIGK